jgi:hypothetical protein
MIPRTAADRLNDSLALGTINHSPPPPPPPSRPTRAINQSLHLRSWVTQSVRELEVHSRLFDEMGLLPASPHNKVRGRLASVCV